MEEDDKHFGQTYKGQSYRDWKNDTDEMDGDPGPDGGCLLPLIAIFWFVVVIFLEYFK